MEIKNHSGATELSLAGPLYWLLSFLSLASIAVVLPLVSTTAGIVMLACWIALIWIAIIFVRGQFHYVAILWVAIYPYCYYLFSFYVKRSIFTFDRALIALLVIEMFVVSRRATTAPSTHDIRLSGCFWGLYLLLCLLTLVGHNPVEALPSYRMLIEGMMMPPILGLYAIRYFPLVKNLETTHLAACILGLGLGITGLIELTTDTDLFPYGSQPLYTDTQILRADGPFEQPVVLSLVGMLAFFFIIYLRRLMPERLPLWRAVLHKGGSLASFGAALLPLNRGLIIALIPIAIIDFYSKHRLISRWVWTVFFGMVIFAAAFAKLHDPRLYDDRVARPNNFYQRVAQQQETLRVVTQYPVFGVGIGLYHDVAASDPRYSTRWEGIQSMNIPHNVVMTVLAEEGIIGFLCYIAAQAFLIRGMWKIRHAYPPGWLAFLYCILIYVLIGLDFATVYFSDINLFYVFVLGILYQMQVRIARKEEIDGLNYTAQIA
jgi:O-Antigen ligase